MRKRAWPASRRRSKARATSSPRWISENADFRKALRKMMFDEGVIVSRKATDAKDEQEKFKMYYDYREPVKAQSLRIACSRSAAAKTKACCTSRSSSTRRGRSISSNASILKQPGDWTPQLELAAEDSWKRLLNPSIQTEVRLELKQQRRRRSHQSVSRESGESAARAAGRAARACLASIPASAPAARSPWSTRPANFWNTTSFIRIQPKNDVAGAMRTLQGADRQTSRAGHRHRQRNGVARNRCAGAAIS